MCVHACAFVCVLLVGSWLTAFAPIRLDSGQRQRAVSSAINTTLQCGASLWQLQGNCSAFAHTRGEEGSGLHQPETLFDPCRKMTFLHKHMVWMIKWAYLPWKLCICCHHSQWLPTAGLHLNHGKFVARHRFSPKVLHALAIADRWMWAIVPNAFLQRQLVDSLKIVFNKLNWDACLELRHTVCTIIVSSAWATCRQWGQGLIQKKGGN